MKAANDNRGQITTCWGGDGAYAVKFEQRRGVYGVATYRVQGELILAHLLCMTPHPAARKPLTAPPMPSPGQGTTKKKRPAFIRGVHENCA